jgi:hypothetical protein
MSIDLLGIEPTVVSRDLKGKIVTFYGDKKSGKTSNAVKFPNSILIAFEKGYNALNNVMAQPVNKWSEFKSVLKQLAKAEVQEKFETVIIDTADIAWDLCEKFVCAKEEVDKVGDIPFGGGYKMTEKEFDEALRAIPLMGYGLVMISHATDKEFKDENGDSYNKIVATLPKKADNIVSRMSDIIGYSRIVDTEDGSKTMLYMRGSTRFEAGSRWKYTPDYIEFNYENLVNSIAEAIEKQEKEDGITAKTEHQNVYKQVTEVSYEDIMNKVKETINQLIEKDEENAAKITKTVEKHLGKGRKLNEASEEQADLISLINDDLKDLL